MIYLDSNVIIRFIEGDDAAREPIQKRLSGQSPLLTSQLSRLECRCKPIRKSDWELLQLYDSFFGSGDLHVLSIDQSIIDEATKIRAALGTTSPDSIHPAAAVLRGATVFLTGDKKLAQFARVAVEVI